MFSGLVKNIGVVESFGGEVIAIRSSLRPQIGASIAINGVCTTAISLNGDIFRAHLSKETRDCIALENLLKPRAQVHLEEALRVSDRLDGHIVQGHIDSVGEILRVERSENGFDFIIAYPSEIRAMLVPKGSVAIDGVSLTINEVTSRDFRLTIIPHTFNNTLFHTYKPARRVNIETDIFVRSVYHIVKNMGDLGANLGDFADKNAESRADSAIWQKIDNILMSY
ncbi:riboflavin synthase [Helicobacter sp. 23-1044]